MEISRSWLLLTLPGVLLTGWPLFRTIASLLQALRGATILSVPLVPSQSVSFAESGAVDLYLEGKRGANLSGLDFTLRDAAGTAVPLESLVLRTTVSGTSRVRLKVRSLHLPHDGTYTLDISGLHQGLDRENRVVFSRPIGGLILRHVLALVGLGFLLVGAVVSTILLLIPRR